MVDGLSHDEGNHGQESADDRLEQLRATLRELEETEGTRANHPGIAQLRWLIAKRTTEMGAPSRNRRTQT